MPSLPLSQSLGVPVAIPGGPQTPTVTALSCRERMTASECLVHPWIKVR